VLSIEPSLEIGRACYEQTIRQRASIQLEREEITIARSERFLEHLTLDSARLGSSPESTRAIQSMESERGVPWFSG
jgi:hypothetical protein